MTNFKPMLASNAKPDQVTYPVYGSVKREGVRAVVTPEDGLVTRSLKPFKNELIYQQEFIQYVEKFCAQYDIYIEGEFYVHGWTFNRIDSCLRGNGNIDVISLHLDIFDCYVPADPDAPFEKRYNFYQWAANQIGMVTDHVHAVEQVLVNSAQEALQRYEQALEQGYEGFCFKSPQGAYKLGRSTLKQGFFTRMKPEDDYDCIVLDIIERMYNLNESETNELGYLYKKQDKDMKQHSGMAQSALVYTPALDQVHKVSLTKGLTDVDRYRVWEDAEFYKGKAMTFIGIPVPGQGIPRSPRFSKWRLDMDPEFLYHSDSECYLATVDQAQVERALEQGCDVINFEMFKQGLLSNK